MGTCYLGSHRDCLPGGDGSQSTQLGGREGKAQVPGSLGQEAGGRQVGRGLGNAAGRQGAVRTTATCQEVWLLGPSTRQILKERKRSRCEARGDPRATVGTWVLGGAGLRGHPVCRARGDLGGQREVVTFSTGFQGRAPRDWRAQGTAETREMRPGRRRGLGQGSQKGPQCWSLQLLLSQICQGSSEMPVTEPWFMCPSHPSRQVQAPTHLSTNTPSLTHTQLTRTPTHMHTNSHIHN